MWKISLWMAIQSLSQLESVYGRARAQTLRDNMDSQLYYRPTDQATADYLEHRLGRRSDFARSQTQRDGAASAEGLSEQAVPLKTAQDIQQLRDEEIIGFHRNLPPLQLTRMDWQHHRFLTQRRTMPPPTLTVLPPLSDLELREAASLGTTLVDPDRLQNEPEKAA
jgi:type IV secretion system protein VirD4